MSAALVLQARRLLGDFVAAGWTDAQTLSLTGAGPDAPRANLGGVDRSRGSLGPEGDYLCYGNPRAAKTVGPLRDRLLRLLGDVQDASLHTLEVGRGHHLVLSARRLSLVARATATRDTLGADALLQQILAAAPLAPREALLLVSPHASAHARLEIVETAERWLAARGRRLARVEATHLVSNPQAVVQSRRIVARGPIEDGARWWTTQIA